MPSQKVLSADAPIPNLNDYGIDPVTGFMPNPPPLRRLGQYYEPWERLMDDLNGFILTAKLRERVDKMPTLSVDSLKDKPEQRRAFIILAFLAHSYLHGVPNADPTLCILPKCIAEPFFKLSKELNINPVVSYSSTALWNWYMIDPTGPLDISNIASLHTYSGSYDESWFYTVPLSIELAGAPAINAIIDAQKAVARNDPHAVTESLKVIADCVEKMIGLLGRMYERCDPAVFWKRIRQYSGGSKNSQSFPDGVFYEGIEEVDRFVNLDKAPPSGMRGTWRKYPGASAGQSPMIHTLDVAFSIEHKPMHGHGSQQINPMIEMRESLPNEFQEFIKALAQAPSIREFCVVHGDADSSLISEFNRVCLGIKAFRDLHIQIATQYIILQRKSETFVGTGGTDLVPFLKQTRQETQDTMIQKQ